MPGATAPHSPPGTPRGRISSPQLPEEVGGPGRQGGTGGSLGVPRAHPACPSGIAHGSRQGQGISPPAPPPRATSPCRGPGRAGGAVAAVAGLGGTVPGGTRVARRTSQRDRRMAAPRAPTGVPGGRAGWARVGGGRSSRQAFGSGGPWQPEEVAVLGIGTGQLCSPPGPALGYQSPPRRWPKATPSARKGTNLAPGSLASVTPGKTHHPPARGASCLRRRRHRAGCGTVSNGRGWEGYGGIAGGKPWLCLSSRGS